jgi:hypothetical protein
MRRASARSAASCHLLARRSISMVRVCIVVSSLDPGGRSDAAARKRSAALDRYSAAAPSLASSAAHAAQRACSAAASFFPSSSSMSDRVRHRRIKDRSILPRSSAMAPLRGSFVCPALPQQDHRIRSRSSDIPEATHPLLTVSSRAGVGPGLESQ